jgi:hypothetical protein
LVKLEGAEFPSKYLECYESALITILRYMGLPEETPLMGTQVYFVLGEDGLSISPRFNRIDEEWKRVHGLAVEALPVVDETDLRDKIVARLCEGMPVCLPVDIYSLPHTPHYNNLHQGHYVDLFGYDDARYYMVCSYYRFMGWVDRDLIHSGFFSPIIEHRYLNFIPELKLEKLSSERVYSLVLESCRNMVGLTVPDELVGVDPQHLGLAGIRTLSVLSRRLVAGQCRDLPRQALLRVSRQSAWVGYSRYWFHELIRTCQQRLLPVDVMTDVQEQFATVVQSWRDVGVRLGAGVHGNRPEMIKRSVFRLEQIYWQEERLFNRLLGALPDYEEGKL